MANAAYLLLISSLLIAATLISPSTVHASGDQGGFNRLLKKPAACQGSVAECLADEEFAMDSESNQRILVTTQYISYGALQRNTIPCSLKGASYYNCQAGASANPYSRGCSTITLCRS